jgi:hypothetical protein
MHAHTYPHAYTHTRTTPMHAHTYPQHPCTHVGMVASISDAFVSFVFGYFF